MWQCLKTLKFYTHRWWHLKILFEYGHWDIHPTTNHQSYLLVGEPGPESHPPQVKPTVLSRFSDRYNVMSEGNSFSFKRADFWNQCNLSNLHKATTCIPSCYSFPPFEIKFQALYKHFSLIWYAFKVIFGKMQEASGKMVCAETSVSSSPRRCKPPLERKQISCHEYSLSVFNWIHCP